MKVKCLHDFSAHLTLGSFYNVLDKEEEYYLIKDDLNNSVWLKQSRFQEVA